jgi:hypothetical protein
MNGIKVTYKNESECTYMRACVVCVWTERKGMTANMNHFETVGVSEQSDNYMHKSDSNMRVWDR